MAFANFSREVHKVITEIPCRSWCQAALLLLAGISFSPKVLCCLIVPLTEMHLPCRFQKDIQSNLRVNETSIPGLCASTRMCSVASGASCLSDQIKRDGQLPWEWKLPVLLRFASCILAASIGGNPGNGPLKPAQQAHEQALTTLTSL